MRPLVIQGHSFFESKGTKVRIFHLNVQCLRKKIGELEHFMHLLDVDFDFLCISEHWLAADELASGLSIGRWSLVTSYSRRNHCHGGVAIFANQRLECEILMRVNSISTEINNEICAIYCMTYDAAVVCIYRSPDGDFQAFVDSVDKILTELSMYRRVIVAGDFNVKFGSPDTKARQIVDVFASYGYYPTVVEPTRLDNCLDNIFTNFGFGGCRAIVMDSGMSDHRAQALTVRSDQARKSEYMSKSTRPLTELGFFTFFQCFSEVSWSFLADIEMELNTKYDLFQQHVLSTFNASFPEKTRAIRCCDNGLYWYDDNLRQMRESYLLIQELYNKYKTTDMLQMRNMYRSIYRDAIDSAKKEASNKFINNSNNKSKAMWQLIKGNKKAQSDFPQSLEVNAMNNFFVGAPEDMVAQMRGPRLPPVAACEALTDSVFLFHSVSPALVRRIMTEMKNSSTVDTYGISPKFIKKNISLFVAPITKLINLVFDTAVFPDSLKIARVLPIHKKGDRDDYRNYRPISILPAFSKLFERALYEQIITHVEALDLLYVNQFGFRKGKKTSDAVVKFVNICTESFEKSEYCVVLFLDLTRAFDCVSHEILLKKLDIMYNFGRQSRDLIAPYLTGRTQYVAMDRQASCSLPVRRGVPQGSILGPLLFLLYFNDFPKFVGDGIECLMYADDATVIVKGNRRDIVEERCSAVLVGVRKWCVSNELCLNDEKTVKMLFSLKKTDFINPEPNKFLGVCISAPYLKFDEHARHVGAVISRNVYLLRNLSDRLSFEVVKTAYHALVQSHIGYAILAWGNSPASAYVFKLQRRAIRVLGGLSFREDCRSLFVSFAIITLPSLYIFESILYAYSNRSDFVTCADVHQYNTRKRDNIYIQQCRLSVTQRGPAYMCQILFNKLPTDMRTLELKTFKATLKHHLIRNAFYSVDEFLNCDFNI